MDVSLPKHFQKPIKCNIHLNKNIFTYLNVLQFWTWTSTTYEILEKTGTDSWWRSVQQNLQKSEVASKRNWNQRCRCVRIFLFLRGKGEGGRVPYDMTFTFKNRCPWMFVVNMYIGDALAFACCIAGSGGGGGGRETHNKSAFIFWCWLSISRSCFFSMCSKCPLWFRRNSISLSCFFSTFNMVSQCLQLQLLGQGIMAYTLYIKLTNAWNEMDPIDGGASQKLCTTHNMIWRFVNPSLYIYIYIRLLSTRDQNSHKSTTTLAHALCEEDKAMAAAHGRKAESCWVVKC